MIIALTVQAGTKEGVLSVENFGSYPVYNVDYPTVEKVYRILGQEPNSYEDKKNPSIEVRVSRAVEIMKVLGAKAQATQAKQTIGVRYDDPDADAKARKLELGNSVTKLIRFKLNFETQKDLPAAVLPEAGHAIPVTKEVMVKIKEVLKLPEAAVTLPDVAKVTKDQMTSLRALLGIADKKYDASMGVRFGVFEEGATEAKTS